MEHPDISYIFKKILAINTKSRRLLTISYAIHLISFNAQIAAAHTGEKGKSLSVMTYEISALAPSVSGYIDMIASAIHTIARRNAESMTRVRHYEIFEEAHRRMDPDNSNIEKLASISDSAIAMVGNSYQELMLRLGELKPVLQSIFSEIKTAEVIGVLLRIEIERSTVMGINTQSFRSLAEELFDSCVEMRSVAKECSDLLDEAIMSARKLERERRTA